MKRSSTSKLALAVVSLAALALGCDKLLGRRHDAGVDDASVAIADPGDASLTTDSGVTCPRPLHGGVGTGYCRFACRGYQSRTVTKHARRVVHPARRGFGDCGKYKVFAEVDKDDAGVTEYFDGDALVGAVDTLTPDCAQYGAVPTCSPTIKWEAAPPIPTLKTGTIQIFDDDEEADAGAGHPNAPNPKK